MTSPLFANAFLRFARSVRAAAAVEAGLTAPFLIIGMVMMMDVGLALGERMDLDRSVRSGVQAVVANVNEPTTVRSLILNATKNPAGMSLQVEKQCKCGGAAATCSSLCTGGTPPSVFINILATRTHQGIIMPNFNLESETHVQLR